MKPKNQIKKIPTHSVIQLILQVNANFIVILSALSAIQKAIPIVNMGNLQ